MQLRHFTPFNFNIIKIFYPEGFLLNCGLLPGVREITLSLASITTTGGICPLFVFFS